jgi:transketolase
MREALINSLSTLAEKNPDVMLLTADLGYGLFDSFAERFPRQYLNVGVCEQNMIGVATGLALEGHTIFAYSIANFATFRCLEHIRNDACYHETNVNIIASGGGFTYGALGMSHHATEDLAIMRTLPYVTAVAPCDNWEVANAVLALAHTPGVGYLRLEKTPAETKSIPEENFQLGKARRLRNGGDMTFIATGSIINEALIAADFLAEKKGIQCRVMSMHTIKPIDEDEIIAAAKETGIILTIEEHTIIGGLGSAVAEVCMEAGIPLRGYGRIGLASIFSSIVGSQQFLRSYYKMDSKAIIEKALNLIK